MDEINFKNWLSSKEMSKKVSSDIVSRLKRIEKYYGDIDDYYNDITDKTLILKIRKDNENKVLYKNNKYGINAYVYAINKYLLFRKEICY